MRPIILGCAMSCILAACADVNAGSDLRFSTQSADMAQAAIAQVPPRARTLDAQGQSIDATTAVVTYSGAPQDYISCETRDTVLQGKLSLDVRSTFAAQEADIVASSLYIVTLERPEFAPVSISFSQADRRSFPNGLRCMSTTRFESALLGQ